MNKIKLDPAALSEDETVLLIARLVNGINIEYPLLRNGLKEYLFKSLKLYSTEKNNFDYKTLLSALYKIYPGEFQKELIK